jgi:hypothetical protein
MPLRVTRFYAGEASFIMAVMPAMAESWRAL